MGKYENYDYDEEFDYEEKEEKYPVTVDDWMQYNGLLQSDFI